MRLYFLATPGNSAEFTYLFHPFNLPGGFRGSFQDKRHNTFENIFLNQLRVFAPAIMSAIFEKVSYAGTQLISQSNFFKKGASLPLTIE